MTDEEKRAGLEQLLRGCPDILTPYSAARWTHHSKNTIYKLIHKGELPAYLYHGNLLISKLDVIDYMVAHTDDEPEQTILKRNRENHHEE